jgi:iron complex outermembrane receptor protein
VQVKANGDFARPLNRTFTKEDYITGQANLTGKFKTGTLKHTLLAGVDADRYLNTSYTYNNPTTYDTLNIFNPNKYKTRTDIPEADRVQRSTTPVNRFGAYVQDLVKITLKLNLLAGIRWTYQKTYGAEVTNLRTGAQITGNWREDKAFSPRIGIVYKPATSLSVFVSYANSFVTNSGFQPDSVTLLKPSLINQYEIGLKK